VEPYLAEAYQKLLDLAEEHKYSTLVILSIFISAVLRLPYFQYDFIFVDEAHWANGANILHQGGRLYLDIALDKNPPIFWFCAFLFKIFGASMMAIHLGSLLLVCATSVLLYLLGSRFFSKGAGAAAALIHAVASTTYYIPRIIGMNTETLMVLLFTIAVLFYLHALIKKRRFAFLIAGFFASWAFLTKPVAAPEVALLVLFLFLSCERAIKEAIYSAAVLVSGIILGLGLFAASLHRSGILIAWWDQAIVYAFRYVARIDTAAFIGKSIRVTLAFVCIFAWLFILIWISRKSRNENSKAYLFLICWIIAAAAGVVAGRRYYANYFLQLVPPLSVMGGLGLNYLWTHRNKAGLRTITKVCGAAFLISFVWFHSRTLVNWLSFAFPQLHHSKLWDMGSEEKRNREIADYIKTSSSPQDKIFIWGSKPQLLFLAQRQPVTGWMDYDVADDYPPHAGDMKNQIRTAEFIRKARPLFIADVQKVATIDKFPIFLDVIEELYAPEIRIHGSRIYRLRDSEAGMSARESAIKPIYGSD
jgi:hypothetical protein